MARRKRPRRTLADRWVVPFGEANDLLGEELYEDALEYIDTQELGQTQAWRCPMRLVHHLLSTDPTVVRFLTYKDVNGEKLLDGFHSRPPNSMLEMLSR